MRALGPARKEAAAHAEFPARAWPGRAALTDNFDACRDLSGRRMRHVNADAKLAEWAAGARERELEKLGLKHTREQERLAQREAAQQVRQGLGLWSKPE